ncbi:MAG: uroporphyrinogen decarboxylase family protein [Calditrichota bacterium]
MTLREQFLALLLEGVIPPRPPIIPMIAADHAARVAGVALGEAMLNADALIEAYITVMDIYAPDGLVFFIDPALEAEAAGLELEFFPDAAPHPAQYTSLKEIRQVDPKRDGRLPVYLKALRELNRIFNSQIPILASLKDPFSLAAQAVDPAVLLEAVILNPTEVEKAIITAEMNQARFLESIIEAGGIPFLGAPLASASLISASVFSRFAAGSIWRLATQAHAGGVPMGLHICGKVNPLCKFIAATEIDLLSVEAIDPYFKALYLSNLVLMGAVRTDILLNGSIASIHREVIRSYELLQPRCVLSSGCDIPADAPIENVRELLKGMRDEG